MSTNIVVPELGESVVEARIAKWLKKEGDAVNTGDPLVELAPASSRRSSMEKELT
jgi:2-oxoglutarate dehydrogenase E2 component (dihydrolipoamide succinyltransferase)